MWYFVYAFSCQTFSLWMLPKQGHKFQTDSRPSHDMLLTLVLSWAFFLSPSFHNFLAWLPCLSIPHTIWLLSCSNTVFTNSYCFIETFTSYGIMLQKFWLSSTPSSHCWYTMLWSSAAAPKFCTFNNSRPVLHWPNSIHVLLILLMTVQWNSQKKIFSSFNRYMAF